MHGLGTGSSDCAKPSVMEWRVRAPDVHKRVAIDYRARKKKGAGALIRLPIQRASDKEVSGAQGLTAGGIAVGPSRPLFVSSPADEFR